MNFMIANLKDDPRFGNQDIEVVLARQVHEQLQSGAKYADWIKERIQQAHLVRGEDYWEFSHNKPTTAATGATKVIEHFVTLDTAKHLAMLERTETGRQVRTYFIERDKQLRQLLMLSPEAASAALPTASQTSNQEPSLSDLQDDMERATEHKERLLSQLGAVDDQIQGILRQVAKYEAQIARIKTASTPAGLTHLRRSEPLPLPPGATIAPRGH